MKALYSLDLNPASRGEPRTQVPGFDEMPEDARIFAGVLIEETVRRLDEIDAHIRKASLKWDIGRMAVVDRNVLRLAVSELTGTDPKPVRVVINEAIELAKRFGGEESGVFVNGVLDRVRIDLGMET